MNAVKLTDTITVAGQISLAQVQAIAAAGFKVLVNNRPDGEEPGQPGSAEFEAAAVAAGMTYYHLPVTAMDFPGPGMAQMTELFDDESRPLFAFCRSGTRCTTLWVASRAGDARAEATQRARSLGYDLGMAARVPG
jgi:uncharacterized protein (TIGR01244 family)